MGNTIKFYTPKEIKELKGISSITDLKLRREALDVFCTKNSRPRQGAENKMYSLRTKKSAVRKERTSKFTEMKFHKNEIGIPIKNITMNNNFLVIKY